MITFRYQELSDGGVPRFPSFVRVSKAAETEPALAGKPTKTASGRAPAKQQAAASESGAPARHFEFVEGTSNKFWEISVAGCQVTVRYGRIGSAGMTNVKTFADTAAAQRHSDKLIAEKTGKGYVETRG